MAGFTDLLGSLIQSGLSKSGSTRITNATREGGTGALGDILGGLTEILGSTNQPGGGLGDILSKGSGSSGGLGDFVSDALEGFGGNSRGLGELGALGGAILGGGKGSLKGALGGGALAMLASLALSALKNAGQQPAKQPAALFKADTPDRLQEIEDDANVIVTAMINAAKADGEIDAQEVKRIIGELEQDGISPQEKNYFMEETNKPFDLDRIVSLAAGRPEMAAQIYAASLLAIEVDTFQEQQYMQALANGMGLDAASVDYIERSLAK